MARARRLTIAVAAVGMLISAAAGAQEYPTKPITLIVPWPAGGSTDISMRAIAESASKLLGQPIAIDNKAGGGGTVGPATMAAAAKPDGYTIAQIPITVFRLPLMQEVSWNPDKDFSYIVHLTGYTFGVTGPKGMDPKIVAKLHDAFKKALEDPAVIATLAKFDMVPNYKNTEDYKKFVVEVTESERKVIDKLGLAKKTN